MYILNPNRVTTCQIRRFKELDSQTTQNVQNIIKYYSSYQDPGTLHHNEKRQESVKISKQSA